MKEQYSIHEIVDEIVNYNDGNYCYKYLIIE